MSTVVLDTITGKSTATTITIGSTPVVSASANSMTIRGEGSAQTSIQQGLAKMFCTFNGTSTIAISDSLNTSSITDRGTGLYTVTINNDMGNANFATCGSSRKTDANEDPNQTTTYHAGTGYTKVVGEVRIATGRGADEYDTPSSEVIVFGDLA